MFNHLHIKHIVNSIGEIISNTVERNEIFPKFNEKTLEILRQIGSNILGDHKKCTNCGYKDIIKIPN
jgi:hypothetical protein